MNEGMHFQTIQNALTGTDIPSSEKEDLRQLFATASDDALAPIATLVSEDKDILKTISANYQAKKRALSDRDAGEWQKIIQDETALLETLPEKD